MNPHNLIRFPIYHTQHLFKPPCYRIADGSWHSSFASALKHSCGRLTWDNSAILSMLSFGYLTGDRTLFREITRQPWISTIQLDNTVHLEAIPPHGYYRASNGEMAREFMRLTELEIENVCKNRGRIFVLLSGGLDSRVVAGILAKLWKEERLAVAPTAVTWGVDNSRDVVYGRIVAEVLGFEWIHVGLGPSDLANNIEASAFSMNASVSPMDLHRLTWFKDAPQDALVLSGSYGDSVGRTEFSGRHLLELQGLRPMNTFGLLAPVLLSCAAIGVQNDIHALHQRVPGVPDFVHIEHVMHACYTRGLLGHAKSIINQYCSLYLVFTHPAVYSYMWSIHPAYRFNRIYVEGLNMLNPLLLHIPWARTNRALAGRTNGAQKKLQSSFHDYQHWVRDELYELLRDRVDPDWYEATGIFSGSQVRKLLDDILKRYRDNRFFSKLLWLAAFRRFAEYTASLGKQAEMDPAAIGEKQKTVSKSLKQTRTKFFRAGIHRHIKGIRQVFLRLKMLGRYPVRAGSPRAIDEAFQ